MQKKAPTKRFGPQRKSVSGPVRKSAPGGSARPAKPGAQHTRRNRISPATRPREDMGTAKRIWKPGTMLYPVPIVMVTCAQSGMRPNIITVAWAGTICSDPPMLSISVRKARHSHGMISASKQFVVNVPAATQIKAADLCGIISGRDEDKFARTGLTAGPASVVEAPIIVECPVNIECVVRRTLELGSHTMFLAEVVAVQVSERLITPSDRLALERAGLAAYSHGEYFELGKRIGFFGFSVRRRKSARR